jgi:hypothetical protein
MKATHKFVLLGVILWIGLRRSLNMITGVAAAWPVAADPVHYLFHRP